MGGGGKWHNTYNPPSVIGKGQTKVGHFSVTSKRVVEEGPGTMDKFTALDNCGNMNKDRTMDWMAWAAMGQDEVKDKLKYTGKLASAR